MISFVLFPQGSQPSMNFNISDMYFFENREKNPLFQKYRDTCKQGLKLLQVSWESTDVCMLFLKLSSNVLDYINFFIAMVPRQTVQP